MIFTEIPNDISHYDYVFNLKDEWKPFGYVPYSIHIDKNALGYYSFSKIDDIHQNYFVLIKFDNHREEDEKLEIREYVKIIQKEFRRRGDMVSQEEILETTFNDKDLDIDNFVINYPFVLWFYGCDDGHWFMRFKSEAEREEYIKYFSSIEKYEDFANIFYPEDSLYKQFVFHSN